MSGLGWPARTTMPMNDSASGIRLPGRSQVALLQDVGAVPIHDQHVRLLAARKPRRDRLRQIAERRSARGDELVAGRLFERGPELRVHFEEAGRDHDLDVGGGGGACRKDGHQKSEQAKDVSRHGAAPGSSGRSVRQMPVRVQCERAMTGIRAVGYALRATGAAADDARHIRVRGHVVDRHSGDGGHRPPRRVTASRSILAKTDRRCLQPGSGQAFRDCPNAPRWSSPRPGGSRWALRRTRRSIASSTAKCRSR